MNYSFIHEFNKKYTFKALIIQVFLHKVSSISNLRHFICHNILSNLLVIILITNRCCTIHNKCQFSPFLSFIE